MTDPLEEALAASTRAIQQLDQQYAAAREANARLTAEIVRLEIVVRQQQEVIHMAKQEVDRMQEMMMAERDVIVTLRHEAEELRGHLASRNWRIDELEMLLTQYGS